MADNLDCISVVVVVLALCKTKLGRLASSTSDWSMQNLGQLFNWLHFAARSAVLRTTSNLDLSSLLIGHYLSFPINNGLLFQEHSLHSCWNPSSALLGPEVVLQSYAKRKNKNRPITGHKSCTLIRLGSWFDLFAVWIDKKWFNLFSKEHFVQL